MRERTRERMREGEGERENEREGPERYMGWLLLVGSLKLYVSFAENRLFYRALLQKRPIILRSLLIVATP